MKLNIKPLRTITLQFLLLYLAFCEKYVQQYVKESSFIIIGYL